MHYCVIMRMNEESYLTIIKKDRDLKKDWKISGCKSNLCSTFL